LKSFHFSDCILGAGLWCLFCLIRPKQGGILRNEDVQCTSKSEGKGVRKIKKIEGVASTLFVPMVARIDVSKRFPEFFYDEKSLELEEFLPEAAWKGASEYTNIVSSSRYYNMDNMTVAFIEKHKTCNVVFLGAGLDTAYHRITKRLGWRDTHYYGVDLPEVIEKRKEFCGVDSREVMIGGDMFAMEWVDSVDTGLPTLLLVSGVFQYFREPKILAFIRALKRAFVHGELIFDATSTSGLKFTNHFIKRTGHADARMYFSVDDCQEFAEKCDVTLLECRGFFKDALQILKGKLKLTTRMVMKFTDRTKRTVILHLKLNP